MADPKQFLNPMDVRTAIERLISERSGNASFARAVKRAVKNLEKSPFWRFDGERLEIISPQSGTHYRGINDGCICESWLANHGFCWHRAAFLILKTMSETETPAPAEKRPARIERTERGITQIFELRAVEYVKTCERVAGVVVWREPSRVFQPRIE